MILLPVLLSIEAHEHGERERELLHLLLARGDAEIAAGNGFSLDEVFVEADTILARGPK